MALGADGIGIANSVNEAISCFAARMLNTNEFPSEIAPQQPEPRRRLATDTGPTRHANPLHASVTLMQVLARATGSNSLPNSAPPNMTTFEGRAADRTGIAFSRVARWLRKAPRTTPAIAPSDSTI